MRIFLYCICKFKTQVYKNISFMRLQTNKRLHIDVLSYLPAEKTIIGQGTGVKGNYATKKEPWKTRAFSMLLPGLLQLRCKNKPQRSQRSP
jgi:hypothetical protein